MNKYVVIISIGPVQSMIASARKSRDLWSGSWLLSELAKSCAKFLKESKAELIFPFVENAKDLEPNSDFSVGNKLQAVIEAPNKDELEKILNQAKQAVQNRYRDEAKNALSQLNQNDIRTDIWQSQIDDLVEIQWAWAKIENGDYINASQKVGGVLASRKNTREFNPLAINPFQSELCLPKSSLDGFRETVLKEDDGDKKDAKKVTSTTRRKLALAKSEQLDVLGVVKRLGFEKDESGKKVAEQFTPISRVMADAWIEKVSDDELKPIREICEDLVRLEVITRVKGNQGIYQKFPYDAQLLYPNRLEVEIKTWHQVDDAIGDNLKLLQKELKPLFKKYGEPYRYGALLLADGDRMGELLDKAKTQEQHQAITQALSNFAGGVAKIMRDYRGHCIYAGGDDVLGLVPLDRARECADALQNAFKENLSDIADKLGVDKKPTLSVGLAICHLMTPFGVVRELAGKAEKYAKGDHILSADEKENNERRNALGILLSVRGGSDIQLRFNWSDKNGLDCFRLFQTYYQDKQIPSRVAYDIRAIYLRTKDFATNKTQAHIQAYERADENGEVKDLQKDIQSAELTRMLKQARTDKGEKIENDVIDELKARGELVGLEQLANELIVARWLSAKTQKDLGKE